MIITILVQLVFALTFYYVVKNGRFFITELCEIDDRIKKEMMK